MIINLLYLMTDSGIKDLKGDPEFSILKVEQKFQALMDDEQAEQHFLELIERSVTSLYPVLMEAVPPNGGWLRSDWCTARYSSKTGVNSDHRTITRLSERVSADTVLSPGGG